MKKTNICIVGAGPGGAATALKLSYLGISSLLIDKAVFPRDKICGDAISGKVTTLLNRLDPTILQRFNGDTDRQIDVWGIKFVAPNGKELDVPFRPNFDKNEPIAPGYVSKRIDFDNFLIEEVKRRKNIQFHEGISIEAIEKTSDGFFLSGQENGFQVHAQLLIVANGAHSSFSRHYAGLEKDLKHQAGAVRAYFQNVSNMHEHNFIELHFIKSIIPGYFWIFPLPNGQANVGLGMRSDFVSNRRFNLKTNFLEIIENDPVIRARFKEAKMLGKITGYSLPLGSKKRQLSGDHFMLVGDAGHLVDPLTGEGIGNAIYSGFIAAEQAQQCFKQKDFSAAYMKAYDVRIARVLGTEMKLSYQLQRMLRYPWLANLLANWIARNRKLIDIISRMYTDFSLRKQLVNPVFWVKLLWKKRV